ncbi:MAG: hypothetical protein V1816_10920 [Pseudomonadota bacterium]
MLDFYLTARPDWSDGVEITRSWRTSIQSAVTGSEKRSALYGKVRRTVSYKVLVLGVADLAYLKRRLWRDMHLVVGVPLWPDGAALTDQVDAGLDLILPVTSTADREFAVGGEAILVDPHDMDNFEVVVVDDLDSDKIYLTDPVAGDWPAHAMVYPVIPCRIEPAQTIRALTAGIGEFAVSAAEEV